MARSSSASLVRGLVELLVTKRRSWLVRRSRSIASTAPGIGTPGDVEDAVDVEENAGHVAVSLPDAGRISHARRRRRSSGSGRHHHRAVSEELTIHTAVSIPLDEIELRVSRSSGPGRPARQHGRDAGRGSLRRGGILGADRRAEAAVSSSEADRSCGRSPRTSARSTATANWRSSASPSGFVTRSASDGAVCRRSRAPPPRSVGSRRSAAVPGRSDCGAICPTDGIDGTRQESHSLGLTTGGGAMTTAATDEPVAGQEGFKTQSRPSSRRRSPGRLDAEVLVRI